MEKNNILVPSLNSKIGDNAAWCVAFDLAWKEFQDKLLENNFSHSNKQIIKDLVADYDKNLFMNDSECYCKSGIMTQELKMQILNDLKNKFDKFKGEKSISDIIEQLDFSNDKNTDKILIYSIVRFFAEFKRQFEKVKSVDTFARYKKRIEYFGADKFDADYYRFAKPLFYKNEKDFAVSIKTEDYKEIILYRTDKKDSFQNIYDEMLLNKDYYNNLIITKLAIPNLHINLQQQYDELVGEVLINKRNNLSFVISNALQTLKLDLTKEGAKVKSEAMMGMIGSLQKLGPTIPVNYVFDDTFYMFIVNDNYPIVALRVQDIEQFNK